MVGNLNYSLILSELGGAPTEEKDKERGQEQILFRLMVDLAFVAKTNIHSWFFSLLQLWTELNRNWTTSYSIWPLSNHHHPLPVNTSIGGLTTYLSSLLTFLLCGWDITLPCTITTMFWLQLLVHINTKQSIRRACSFLMKRNNKTFIAAELAVHGRGVQGSALYQHSFSLRMLPSRVLGQQQPYAVQLGDPGSVLYCAARGRAL